MHEALHSMIARLKPDICVIEHAFFGINAQSALKLGQARGALISAIARYDLPLVELAPTEVKKLITGSGRASKQLVSDSLKSLIGFQPGKLPFDTTDAVAIALSYGVSAGPNTQLADKASIPD